MVQFLYMCCTVGHVGGLLLMEGWYSWSKQAIQYYDGPWSGIAVLHVDLNYGTQTLFSLQ